MNRQLKEWIDQLARAGENPKQTIVKAMKESGREAVGCFPIYAPEEIVHAAGFLPVGMWGGQGKGQRKDRYLQTFCCSVMKANMEQALRGDYDFLKAILIPVYCDTLKCVLENFKTALPQQTIIAVVYPQNRKLEPGQQFLTAEFQRIQGELEKIAGKAIPDEALESSFQLYEEYRLACREFVKEAACRSGLIDAKTRHFILKAAWFMEKKQYVEILTQLTQLLKEQPREEKRQGKRIILTGLMSEPAEILDILHENGLTVTADDLAHQSRQFRVAAKSDGSALERMTDRVANQDGCAFLYDEAKSRGSRLKAMAEEYQAEAVVYCQMKFCDPDEFDFPVVKKVLGEAKIPLLHLEVEQQMDSVEQLRTRIQSFAEMLG